VIEARNLGKAVEYAATWVADGKSFQSVECLLWLHKKILEELDDAWAGKLREHGVSIRGAKYQPPDHTLVPSMVEHVIRASRFLVTALTPSFNTITVSRRSRVLPSMALLL